MRIHMTRSKTKTKQVIIISIFNQSIYHKVKTSVIASFLANFFIRNMHVISYSNRPCIPHTLQRSSERKQVQCRRIYMSRKQAQMHNKRRPRLQDIITTPTINYHSISPSSSTTAYHHLQSSKIAYHQLSSSITAYHQISY